MKSHRFLTWLLAAMIVSMAAAATAQAGYSTTEYKLTPSTTQAAGHPKLHYHLLANALGADLTGGDDLKTFRVDLPAGLQVNANSPAPRCAQASFLSDSCLPASQVGTASVKWRDQNGLTVTASGTAYLLEGAPTPGNASVGLVLRNSSWKNMFLIAGVSNVGPVRPSPNAAYGTTLTIDEIPRKHKNSSGSDRNITFSAVNVDLGPKTGSTQNGSFFVVNPSRCSSSESRATIITHGGFSTVKTAAYTPGGCGSVPFNPTASIGARDLTSGRPTGLVASFGVPTADATIQHSNVRAITVDIGGGMTISSSAIAAQTACASTALAGDSCPAASRIGSATANVPYLSSSMSGDIYITSTTGGSLQAAVVLRGGGSTIVQSVSAAISGSALRFSASAMPQIAWSNVSLDITSPLFVNGSHCGPVSATTTFNAYSGAAATRAGSAGSLVCPPPETTITSSPPSPSSQTDATVAFTSDAPNATFVCSVDGVASACPSPLYLTDLEDGTHEVCVTAVASGVSDPTPACVSFMVDSTAPNLWVVCTPTTGTGSADCSWWVTDEATWIQSVSCTYDGVPQAACPPTATFNGAGTHSYSVTAIDASGNTAITTVSFTFSSPPPETTITSSPPSPSAQTDATVEFTSDVAGSTFVCSVDGAAAACASPLSLTELEDGNHEVCVTATANGVSDPSPACVSFVVDSTAPNLWVVCTPTAGTSNADCAWWITDEASAIATVSCTYDGVPLASCPPNATFTGGGTHTYSVTAIDAAGNTAITTVSFTFSWPPIDTSITSGPGATSGTFVTFSFSGTPAGISFQCRLDGGAWSACTSPRAITGLSQGSHTFCVRGVDQFGNLDSTPDCRTWTVSVDTVAPSIDDLSVSHGALGATVTYEASDDSSADPTCTPASGTTFPFYGSGALIIEVVCRDAIGNFNSSTLNVGSNGPAAGLVATLSGGPDGNTSDDTPTFAYTINRAATGTLPCSAGQTCASVTVPLIEFSCMVDGNAVPCSAGSYTSPSLELGRHTFCVSARGIYSGETSAIVCRSFKVILSGATPPVVTITSPFFFGGSTGASPTNVGYQVNGSSTIPAGTTCTVNEVPSTTPTTNAAVLNYGTNAIPVTCTNASGSDTKYFVMTRYASFGVTLTTPAPNSTTSSSSVNVTYNRLNIGSSVACTINGVPSTSGSINDVALPMGTSSIDLVCRSGNNVARSSINVTRGAPPAVAIVDPANNSVVGSSTNVSYTVDGSTSIPTGTTCRVNGAASMSATSNSVALASGTSLITVSCSNPYGFNTATVTVYRTVPTITGGPTGLVNTNNATFTFTGLQSGWIYQCQLDGAAWDECVPPAAFTALSDGPHSFCVRLANSTGSSGAATCRTWTVDTIPPPPPIVLGPSGIVLQNTATITISNPEPGTTTQGSLDGAAFATVSSPVTLTGLAETIHVYSARSVDAAGNVSSATSIAWQVTHGDPGPVRFTAGPSEHVSTTEAFFSFTSDVSGDTYECSLDGDAFAACMPPTHLVGLAEGPHTYCVRAIGATGYVGPPTCRSWIIDTTPPVITDVTPVDGTHTTESSITLSFTATDENGNAECSPNSGTSIDLVPGPNTIIVSCVDIVSNATTTEITIHRDIATEVPTVTITAPTDGTATTAAAVTVNYSVTPAGASCDHVSGTNKLLSNGVNTITVTCTNSAGSGSASVQVTKVGFLSVSGSCTTTSGTDANCTWSSSGGAAPYTTTCSLDGATPGACTGSSSTTVSFAQPMTTSHTMRVCISDSSNQSTCTNLAIVPQGSTGNVVNITSGPGDGSIISTSTATFTYAATQQTTGTPCPVGQTCLQVVVDITPYYCSFDGGAYQFCGVTSPTFARFVTPTLSNGAHTFCVKASGVAGIDPVTRNAIPNGVYGPSTCRSFTRTTTDTTPPVITITAPTSGQNVMDPPGTTTLRYTVVDNLDPSSTCDKADGSTVSPVGNSISVTCVDDSGNSTTATVNIVRVVIESYPVITAPVNGSSTYDESTTLIYSAPYYENNGSCNIPSGSTVPLNLGSNTITVACTDLFGNTSSSSVTVTRTLPPTTGEYRQVSLTYYTACATTTNDTVRCWGYDAMGLTGGSSGNSSLPRDVLASAGGAVLTGVQKVSVGSGGSACVLMTEQTVKCWGSSNNYGQTGNGTIGGNNDYPSTVVSGPGSTSPLTGAVDITTGGIGSCALMADTTVKCWGYNGTGAVGDNTTVNRPEPVSVVTSSTDPAPLSGVVSLSPNGGHTCATLVSTQVVCWGDNSLKAINNQSGNALAPVTIFTNGGISGTPVTGAVQAAGGGWHSCVRFSDTTASCWGRSGSGMLGGGYGADQAPQMQPDPRPVVAAHGSTTPLTGIASLDPDGLCAVMADTSLRCWGENVNGAVGDGTYVSRDYATPVLSGSGSTAPLTGVASVSSGTSNRCAVLLDGRLRCWGSGEMGTNGDGTFTNRNTPVAVGG